MTFEFSVPAPSEALLTLCWWASLISSSHGEGERIWGGSGPHLLPTWAVGLVMSGFPEGVEVGMGRAW